MNERRAVARSYTAPSAVESKPELQSDSVVSKPSTVRLPDWVVPAMLLAADVSALAIAYVLSTAAIGPTDTGSQALAVILVVSLPMWLLAFKTAGLYDRDKRLIGHSTVDEIADLARVSAICSAIVVVLAWTATSSVAHVEQIVVFWFVVTLCFVTLRAVTRAPIRRLPRFRQNALIVGAGSVGQLLGVKLLQHPEYRLNLVGFVDDMPMERREDLDELAILGSPSALPTLISDLHIDRVIVAFSNDSTEETSELVRLLHDSPAYIDLVPRLFDVIPPGVTSHAIEGIPLISLPRLQLSSTSRVLKRSLDLVVSSVLMVLLAPLFGAIAIITKFDSRGPVFFRQVRMGADERTFRILKFRTMLIDADDRKHEVGHLNRHARPGGDPRMFKVVDDPRVTGFGRFLRRFSIDELPQLINVLRGEMSLVGPRPLILEEDYHVETWGRMRLALKPGITGLWQVSGRNSIPFEEMVKLDYLYVTNWSLSNDLRLLLQTLPIVARGDAP